MGLVAKLLRSFPYDNDFEIPAYADEGMSNISLTAEFVHNVCCRQRCMEKRSTKIHTFETEQSENIKIKG